MSNVQEYTEASKRLIEKALSNGDSQMLADIKIIMDTVSKLQNHITTDVTNRIVPRCVKCGEVASAHPRPTCSGYTPWPSISLNY